MAMSKAALLPGIGAPDKLPPVIALHCSGSSGRQWNKLASALGDCFALTAPDLISAGATPHWSGEGRSALADEAARIIEIIDAWDGPVHLVGHSYGGAVALYVAHTRPARIASMALYEPCAFHVLNTLGPDGQIALDEIESVAGKIAQDVADGDCNAAAARFVDYWNGPGTWAGMKPESRAALLRSIPNAPREFRALFDDPTPLAAYRRLACPVLLMRGELAPLPTALIAHALFSVMPGAAIETIAGAGHMGPFSHTELVNEKIASHVLRASGLERLRGAPAVA
jgi:pimeloyl-ACP methyl ester carboxylesterase